MLVACQLVNLTTWKQAEPVFRLLLARYLSPEALASARPGVLEGPLRPLGLWRRRAIILPRFARAWLLEPPTTYDEVLKLPGCGKYAADSWSIFIEGRLDVQPRDGKLNWYLEEMTRRDRRIQEDREVQETGVWYPRTDVPDQAKPGG